MRMLLYVCQGQYLPQLTGKEEKEMKKLLSLLLVFCLIVPLAACGSSAGNGSSDGSSPQSTSSSASVSSDTKTDSSDDGDTLGTFNQSAALAETVMFDEDGVKITATGLNYTSYSVDLELTIENNSDRDLSFVTGSIGYSCNSVNGYMISDGYLNCDVSAGKKANDSISFSYDALMLYGINEIADMEIGFDVSDDDGNDTYTGPCQVTTSAFDAHDYSKDCYQETIASRAAMNTYNYEITHFSQDTLYDVNGVKLLSSGIMQNSSGEITLLLELENTTSDIVYVSTSDIALNGLIVSSSTWSSDAINPGKRGILDVELSSVLDSEYWSIYGIKEVGSVALSLRQRDIDGNDIADKTAVEIVVPDAKAEFDATGTEVYNNDGLRIEEKAVLEDSSDYSSDIHVLLLAENNSGKALKISDVYNSLSVNGFMTSYYYYSQELADGECAALEITLLSSSLKSNQITSASDIEEIEFSLEIKEGRTTIDTPVIAFSLS